MQSFSNEPEEDGEARAVCKSGLYAHTVMSLVFYLRRTFDRGAAVGSAKIFVSARGALLVSEGRDDSFKRNVRTAHFTRDDGGEDVPPLRDVEFLLWTSAVFVLTGVEQVADDRLDRPRLYAQTWQLVPDVFEALETAERNMGRLVNRLRELGVPVQMLPGGKMRIPGERRPDNGLPVDG